MKKILVCLLFFCSYTSAWELQYKTKCVGWRLATDKFNLCFPERYYIKRVNKNAITFESTEKYESVMIKFFSSNEITQENEKLFKLVGEKLIYERKVYVYKSTNDDEFSVRFGKFLINDNDKESFQVVVGNGGDDVALERQLKEILSVLKEHQ